MNQKRSLFVCGCPRSGSSALALWLGKSDGIAIGMERYQTYWRTHLELPTGALSAERFFDIRPGDTWYDSFDRFADRYERLRQDWDRARYVGDKVPAFWRNLPGLIAQYPESRIFYSYRDPFSVARSYKARAMNEADPTWARHRDASFGILEWNESVRRIVEFFNADPATGGSPFDRCFILKYEELVSNSIDRRTIAAFLEWPDPLPMPDGWDRGSPKGRQEILSEAERDLLWSLLDQPLIAEVQRIVAHQQGELKRQSSRSNGPGRREWYHKEDLERAGIAYGELRFPGCTYVFRGRETPWDGVEPYAACIGSATTFGRFIRKPYPQQLEEATGRPFINLGIGGARPEAYLANTALMNLLRRSSLVVAELMSARGYPSALFSPLSCDGNIGLFMDWFGWRKHRKDDAQLDWLLTQMEERKAVFIDRVYEVAFKYLSADQRDFIRDSILSHYLKDFGILAQEVGKPIVGLLISRAAPFQARNLREPKDYYAWSGDYPHFVDDIVIESLRQHGIPVVVSRSQRGFPYRVHHWVTGEPAAVFPWKTDPALNEYYPSQEMHDDAAQALLQDPAIQALCVR